MYNIHIKRLLTHSHSK